jgi:heme/copper-type cytochrome/quinol oxidase subunit 2
MMSGAAAVLLAGSWWVRGESAGSRRADQTSSALTFAVSMVDSERPQRWSVEARGVDMKWAFAARSESEPPSNPQTVSSTLTVRSGDTIDFTITSDDYIYILHLPDGQREIGVPDMVHRLTYVASQRGRFELLADPMCGLRLLHDPVQGVLTVHD